MTEAFIPFHWTFIFNFKTYHPACQYNFHKKQDIPKAQYMQQLTLSQHVRFLKFTEGGRIILPRTLSKSRMLNI